MALCKKKPQIIHIIKTISNQPTLQIKLNQSIDIIVMNLSLILLIENDESFMYQ